jgi:hypothetical protein
MQSCGKLSGTALGPGLDLAQLRSQSTQKHSAHSGWITRFQLSSDQDWGYSAYLYRTTIDVAQSDERYGDVLGLPQHIGDVLGRTISQRDYSEITADDIAVGCAVREHWAGKLDEILAETADRYTRECWAMATGKRAFVPIFAVSMTLSYLKNKAKITVDSQ